MSMTEAHARRIGNYALDAGLDAQIVTLAGGADFCVRVLTPHDTYHVWNFEDWGRYCEERKKRRKQRQPDAQLQEVSA